MLPQDRQRQILIWTIVVMLLVIIAWVASFKWQLSKSKAGAGFLDILAPLKDSGLGDDLQKVKDNFQKIETDMENLSSTTSTIETVTSTTSTTNQ